MFCNFVCSSQTGWFFFVFLYLFMFYPLPLPPPFSSSRFLSKFLFTSFVLSGELVIWTRMYRSPWQCQSHYKRRKKTVWRSWHQRRKRAGKCLHTKNQIFRFRFQVNMHVARLQRPDIIWYWFECPLVTLKFDPLYVCVCVAWWFLLWTTVQCSVDQALVEVSSLECIFFLPKVPFVSTFMIVLSTFLQLALFTQILLGLFRKPARPTLCRCCSSEAVLRESG